MTRRLLLPLVVACTALATPAGASDGTFVATGSLIVPRAEHTATRLPDGKVLVTGGITGTVAIDIKPGAYPNPINLRSRGTLPVAILSAAAFDARTVDPLTVTLAGAPVKLRGRGAPMASFEDVNRDGLLDLVVHVDTAALQLSTSDREAVLTGRRFGGRAVRGQDSVRVMH